MVLNISNTLNHITSRANGFRSQPLVPTLSYLYVQVGGDSLGLSL